MASIAVIGCLSNGRGNPDYAAASFINGLNEKDIDSLMAAYHDNADVVFVAPTTRVA